jgi:hypothetical protein
MCPLRVILIFLSATIAGFFLLRNLKAEPDLFQDDDATAAVGDDGEETDPTPLHSKVLLLISAHIRTTVVMPFFSQRLLGLCTYNYRQ